ncbi:hypothetical protein [Streptomyces sp. NPDC002889]|uniref:hypothetical protein n=1 Tax=Streptomyces sp. NPDC002889 TaxID=3364669 RepID=UPI00369BC093
MGSEGHHADRRPQSEPVCPACGQPVGTVIKRQKIFGAFVPAWEPGPCRNPECTLCIDKQKDEPGHEVAAS